MAHAFHASTAPERGPKCVKIPEPVCGTFAAEPLISKEICELERWRSAVTQGAIARGAFLNSLLCKWTSGLSHVPGMGEGRRRGNPSNWISHRFRGMGTSESASLEKVSHFLHILVCAVGFRCLLQKQFFNFLVYSTFLPLPSVQPYNSHIWSHL